MKTIVSVKSATKDYALGNTTVQALRGVTLDVHEGEFLSIAGPSGSGKTTLLNLIGCVDVPTAGTVEVAGKDTRKLSERELTRLRLHTIGFIFQSFNLVSVLTVLQNVELPLLLQRTPVARARAAGAGPAGTGGHPRVRQAPPQRAVGRTATAGGHRPGAGQPAAAGAGRRAHRQPGLAPPARTSWT